MRHSFLYDMKVIRYILKAAGVLFCLAGLVLSNATTTPNAGNIAGTAAFGVLLLLIIFWKQVGAAAKALWKRAAGKVLLIAVGSIAAAGLGLCVFFSSNMAYYGSQDCEDADCVIVLGCQVRGEQPGRMLTRRLTKALELLDKRPQAVCIVSGGQGSDEDISEAEAMKRWLTARGIAEERIFTESASTSTEENLMFTAKLIGEQKIEGKFVVVTNEFHQFRAHLYAKRAGLDVSHASAATGVSVLNSWIREWMAIVAIFL